MQVRTVSRRANSESMPSRNNMKKNITVNSCGTGSVESASGYEMKARP